MFRQYGFVLSGPVEGNSSGVRKKWAEVSMGCAVASVRRQEQAVSTTTGTGLGLPPPGRLPGPDQGQGTRREVVGSTGGGAEPRIGGRIRDALRLELSAGSGVGRRADGGVAALRGAEDE